MSAELLRKLLNIVPINEIYMFWKAYTKYNKVPKIRKVLTIYTGIPWR